MRFCAMAMGILLSIFGIFCGGKFDNTIWECKYDYMDYQDRMTGVNVLEFLPGRKVKGTFSNPAPLPPSVLIYTYKVEGNKIICTNPDVDTRILIIKEDRLESEDGKCVYVPKKVVAKEQQNQTEKSTSE